MTTILDTIVPLHAADLPEEDRRMELIDGSLHVSPGPSVGHQVLVARLTVLLQAVAPQGVLVLPGANLLRARPEGDTLLIPDVLAFRRDEADEDALYLDPEQVVLVCEVVSPSSRRMDVVTKRAVYAEWGVPVYVVVDPAHRTTDGFVLHAGEYARPDQQTPGGLLAPGWPVRTSDIW